MLLSTLYFFVNNLCSLADTSQSICFESSQASYSLNSANSNHLHLKALLKFPESNPEIIFFVFISSFLKFCK